jgi:predicted tellurium resistance membrane protein TerC
MFNFGVLLTADGIIGLITLTFMEIILGIDNIIFISIVAGKLPSRDAKKARNIGLLLALGIRLFLLSFISWIVKLTYPVITLPESLCNLIMHGDHGAAATCGLSWRDLILLVGGLFLVWKSVSEIHAKFSGEEHSTATTSSDKKVALNSIILQIVALDIVFSFDSILTAVGLSNEVLIMMMAVIISLGVMMSSADAVSNFINKRPSMKILALSFLILIGFMLVLEGLHQHVDKGYIYFAMAFAFIVELVNSRLRRKSSH